ncbi:MAG TPA: glycosyltransferase family 39 protein [Actinomycetota bacterium]|nr:glycosyltransferase family 39 protein [Actinomycetota bacterium]
MRGERALLILIVCAFVASVSFSIAQRIPFENDESVYATQARAWAAGGPITGVGLQRAPLLPAIGTILYKAGARAEWPFRLVGLLSGVAAVLLTWGLARAVAGPTAGLTAAALFASVPNVQQRSAQFMTDVPATALMLAFALIVWRNRERAGPSLLVAAPIAAAAVYLRYASILPIVVVAAVALGLWHRGLLRDRRLAAGTLGLFGALLIPHIVRAIDATGRPWGLVTFTAGYAGRRYFGQGLVQYLAWWPYTLAGPIAAIGMTAGIFAAARRRSQAAIFLVVCALLDIVLIGLTDHGEPRFVFFPVALLCIGGAIAISEAVGARRVAAVIVAGAVVAAGITTALHTSSARTHRIAPVLAGRIVRAHAHLPCTVHSVEIVETTWYSGCSTTYFGAGPADFAVFFSTGGVRLAIQPASPPPGAVPIGVVRDNGRRLATVYVLARPVQ